LGRCLILQARLGLKYLGGYSLAGKYWARVKMAGTASALHAVESFIVQAIFSINFNSEDSGSRRMNLTKHKSSEILLNVLYKYCGKLKKKKYKEFK